MAKVISKFEEYDLKTSLCSAHVVDTRYYCPCCGICYGSIKMPNIKFCYNCGEKIEWEIGD